MLMIRRFASRLALVLAALSAGHECVSAQSAVAASAANVTRGELEAMLTRAIETGASASAEPVREQAQIEASLIRRRLEAGDLRAGDRIALVVTSQPLLTDTFTVSAERTIDLPGLGDVEVEGVLRSELLDHLSRRISTVTSATVLEARVLVPLEIRGSVLRPGVYAVPTETPVADVLSVAGGATSTQAQGRIRIRRGGDVIWEGHALTSAQLMGLSLDQISVAAGDRLEVAGGSEGFGSLLRTSVLGVGAVATFVAVLVQAF
jgi:protein involved in polysaccharide export with SLBB domain